MLIAFLSLPASKLFLEKGTLGRDISGKKGRSGRRRFKEVPGKPGEGKTNELLQKRIGLARLVAPQKDPDKVIVVTRSI